MNCWEKGLSLFGHVSDRCSDPFSCFSNRFRIDFNFSGQFLGPSERWRTQGDRAQSAVSCGFLRKSSVFCEICGFCGFLRPPKAEISRRRGESAKICGFLRKSAVFCSLCHLSSVTLSSAWISFLCQAGAIASLVVKFCTRGFEKGPTESKAYQKNCSEDFEARPWLTFIIMKGTLGMEIGNSQRGGQNVSCAFGGGGGERTVKRPLQTQFWRPQKVGFVWSVPVSSMENDIAWAKGGGNRITSGGGSKTVFGEGFYFLLPWVPPPLCFSLKAWTGKIQKGTGGRGWDRQSCHSCRKSSQIVVTFYDEFYDDLWRFMWADPGVLWKKAPRAMRAMRGKTLETVPFQPYFGCTESFLKVLSN